MKFSTKEQKLFNKAKWISVGNGSFNYIAGALTSGIYVVKTLDKSDIPSDFEPFTIAWSPTNDFKLGLPYEYKINGTTLENQVVNVEGISGNCKFEITLAAETLSKEEVKTLKAMDKTCSRDRNRPFMHGLHYENGTFAATDGCRLATLKVSDSFNDVFENKEADFAEDFMKYLLNEKAVITEGTFMQNDAEWKGLYIVQDSAEFFVKYTDVRYPNWKRVLDEDKEFVKAKVNFDGFMKCKTVNNCSYGTAVVSPLGGKSYMVPDSYRELRVPVDGEINLGPVTKKTIFNYKYMQDVKKILDIKGESEVECCILNHSEGVNDTTKCISYRKGNAMVKTMTMYDFEGR